MIYSEFKIVNKKDGTKRFPYTEDIDSLKVGSLLDIEFPEEELTWECRVDKINWVSNGKDDVLVFEVLGITTVWPDGTRGYRYQVT